MIIRSLLLLLPLAMWTYLFINPNVSRKDITASFLGFVWAFIASLILNSFLLQHHIWHTAYDDNLFYGVPLDWVFSQAIISGALIPLGRLVGWHSGIRGLVQFAMIVLVYYFAGLTITEFNAGIVILSIFLICSSPAMLLSDWTANDTHLYPRSVLQALAWMGLLLWLFPSTVFYLTPDSWDALLQRNLLTNALYILPMILPGYLLISALVQFATEGGGTAFPYDPPKKLVTGGIYQYLSNPMQVGICLMMGWWGFVIHSSGITISAFIAVILFIVFKDVCNGSCAIGEGNQEWEIYQREVPKWIPRFKP